jgi:hypothetical protein
MTEKEKARKRQELLSGKSSDQGASEDTPAGKPSKRANKRNSIETVEAGTSSKKKDKSTTLDLLDQSLCCPICQELCDRPVSVSLQALWPS